MTTETRYMPVKPVEEKEYTVYISDDGKEFDSEMACIRYEKEAKLNKLMEAHPERLEYVSPYFYRIAYFCCDNGYDWIKIKDENDLKILRELVEGNSWSDGNIDGVNIGDTICIESELYDCDYWIYELSDTVKNMSEFLKHFGYGVVKLEEGINE